MEQVLFRLIPLIGADKLVGKLILKKVEPEVPHLINRIGRVPVNDHPVAVVESQVITRFNGNIMRVGISYHGFS